MDRLDTLQLIALAATLGWASGIRLYAVLFIVGGLGYLGWFELPEHLRILAHPLLLVLALLVALTIWLLPKLWRFTHAFVVRILRWFGHADAAEPQESRQRHDV